MVTLDCRLSNMVLNRLNKPSDGDIVVPQRATSTTGMLIHGLNGLRVTLTGFDVGVKAQKALFGVLMLVAAVALAAAVLKIFGG